MHAPIRSVNPGFLLWRTLIFAHDGERNSELDGKQVGHIYNETGLGNDDIAAVIPAFAIVIAIKLDPSSQSQVWEKGVHEIADLCMNDSLISGIHFVVGFFREVEFKPR